jgi:NhaP-type Na+/H+ or K+/H+ antiporter
MTLSHAGLRGAIAYALSLNFPVVVDGNGRSVRQLIVNVTTFVILTTVFILAPTTPPLLKCLKIPMGKDYTSGSGTAGMRPWQRKVQSINQQKIIAFFTRPPAEHAHVHRHKNTECASSSP